MKSLTCWLAAAVSLAMCLAGCRAPAPTFKDVSPFGATRIEPPRTNSFGNPDLYYQPPGSNPAGAGAGLGDRGPDEQLVTLPRGGQRAGDISLVRFDEPWEDEGDASEDFDDRRSGSSDDDLAWGGNGAIQRAPQTRGQPALAGSYQPGSVAQSAPQRDEHYGQVPEPATLLILDASPLPGETDSDWRESASTSTPTATSSARSTATSTSSSPSSRSSGSDLRLNPMPVHDVTSFAQDDSPPRGGTDDHFELRDISQLPPVPEAVRQRLDRDQAAEERTIMRSPGTTSTSTASSGDAAGWRVR